MTQIIEYEDFDNQTGGYQVNEYEYEEEDERYGPAEREGEFSLSAEVPAADAPDGSSQSPLRLPSFRLLPALTQNLPEKGEKGEPGYLGPVRKTLTLNHRAFVGCFDFYIFIISQYCTCSLFILVLCFPHYVQMIRRTAIGWFIF